jgi:hypothetical protein
MLTVLASARVLKGKDSYSPFWSMAPTGSLAADWKFWSRMFRRSLPKTVRPDPRTRLGGREPEFDRREWKTLVSADTVPREVLSPDGSCEVLKRWQDASPLLQSFQNCPKTIETLLSRSCACSTGYTTKKHEHSKVFHAARRHHTQSAEPTSFVNMLLNSLLIRRLLRDCDLSETATQKLVSLICPRSLQRRYRRGFIKRLGTYGFVWGTPGDDELYQSVKVMFPGLPSLCPPRGRNRGLLAALTHLRLVVEYYVIIPNKSLVAFIAIARVLLVQNKYSMDLHQVPHGLRSRSRDTYLHSEVANPHYVALGKGSCESQEAILTILHS